jgi:hypothetical protein
VKDTIGRMSRPWIPHGWRRQHGAAVTLPKAPSAPGEDAISSTFDSAKIALMLDSMEFNDESTWPADVLEYLEKHHSLLLAWAKRGEGPMPCPVMPEHYDRALNGLRRVLNNHALHGYHCTRLTEAEIEHIKPNGMQLPNGAMLKRRIEALEAAGLISTEIARALVAENSADDENRAGKLWFCFFPPYLGGENGIESLLRYWGGEALYRWHDRHPERGPILASIGIPCLVEADIPIASLNEISFLENKAVD